MDCERVEQLLSAHPVAELAPEEQAALEAHLAECTACRERRPRAPRRGLA